MEPAGIVMSFAGATAPEGWLLCDGSAVSRSSYSALFSAIGTTYGAGDGSTTFNLPDLTGRVVIGVSGSHALGSTGGEASHVLTSGEMPAHVHEVPSHGHANDIKATVPALTHSLTQPVFKYTASSTASLYGMSSGSARFNSVANANGSRKTNAAVDKHSAASCTMSGGVDASSDTDTTTTGGGQGHNNLQPYATVNYIISTGD